MSGVLIDLSNRTRLTLRSDLVPLLRLQAALPEIQEQHGAVVKEIKALQQQEHAMQEESLSIRLRVEQIDTTIAEHNNKIKHWQKEVEAPTRPQGRRFGPQLGR